MYEVAESATQFRNSKLHYASCLFTHTG